MKKVKLQTLDDLKRVVEFRPEHAKGILATSDQWEKAPKDAAVTEVYPYPDEESQEADETVVVEVAETAPVATETKVD